MYFYYRVYFGRLVALESYRTYFRTYYEFIARFYCTLVYWRGGGAGEGGLFSSVFGARQ